MKRLAAQGVFTAIGAVAWLVLVPLACGVALVAWLADALEGK